MKYSVFISYSHEDGASVAPVVKLIQAVRGDLVFQDTVNLIPGKKWATQIQEALNQSHMVILFWCRHSMSSEYVKKEWQSAISQNKDILPILLDDTKLIPPLSDYQWIDFRNIEFHKKSDRPLEGNEHSPLPAPNAPSMPLDPMSSNRRATCLIMAIVTVVLLAGLYFLFVRGSAAFGDKVFGGTGWIIAGVIVGIIIIVMLFRIIYSKIAKRNGPVIPPRRTSPVDDLDKKMREPDLYLDRDAKVMASMIVQKLDEKMPRTD